ERNNNAIGAYITKPFHDPATALLFFLRCPQRPFRQRYKCGDQCHKREGVHEKCGCRAPPPDKKASHRWTDQTRSVKHRSVESNRCGDFITLHQLRHKRTDSRHFVSESNPQKQGKENNVPDADLTAHY